MKLADLRAQRATLTNGLRIAAVPMPHVHRSVLEVQLRIGSRFESQKENGISHFLEHMLYRGTRQFPNAHQQALAFEALGGTLQAATAKDFGSLQVALPPERFEQVLPLVAEVYAEPRFSGIDIERGIVHEEILEGLDESGQLIDADDLLAALMFPEHPLGFPITGSPDHVQSFGIDLLRSHHQRFYVGSSTVLVAAGPIDAEHVLRQLEGLFGQLPIGSPAPAVCPAPQGGPAFRFVEHAASQTALRVGFRAPSFADPTEPATQLLMRLLDDGLSTRLYEHICDRKGLCYDVAGGYEAYEDVGLVDLSAECANERAAQVLEELLHVVTELRNEGPSSQELDKAKERHGWQLEQMLDDPEEIASYIALAELTATARDLQTRREQLAAVTRTQVMDAAQSVFRAGGLNIVAVGSQPRRGRERLERIARDYQ